MTPREKPHGCIRFSLPCIPEGVVGIVGWGHWSRDILLGVPEARPAQTTHRFQMVWVLGAERVRHGPCPLGVSLET